ncbi:uncharacterized protein VNE69_03254 [Vairimorpha necatrix]|uniref:Uncharacterized protein n=1 Tax=Vairimorpha necatrix TaxID=6039 RepID=A0AAX4JB03_9MICR
MKKTSSPKLSREELLDLAINGKRPKDCKYKIVSIIAENEVGDYISRNRSALTKIISDLRQNWKKYVPVDKAIKVIKNGLSDNPTVSHKEFFLSELNIEQLGKYMKVDSKHHNEQ